MTGASERDADRATAAGASAAPVSLDAVDAPPGDTAPRPEPGEVRPRGRLLGRAPAERFAESGAAAAAPVPRLGRGARFGFAAALAVALVWLLLAGVADISWGLIAVAVAGAWLIGSWVTYGCWGEVAHPASVRSRELAVAFSLGAWLAGWVGTYLWTRIILPGSTLDLAGRIAQTPFTAWFGALFGPVEVLELVAFAVVAWWTAS